MYVFAEVSRIRVGDLFSAGSFVAAKDGLLKFSRMQKIRTTDWLLMSLKEKPLLP
jgi:hypothetical protein